MNNAAKIFVAVFLVLLIGGLSLYFAQRKDQEKNDRPSSATRTSPAAAATGISPSAVTPTPITVVASTVAAPPVASAPGQVSAVVQAGTASPQVLPAEQKKAVLKNLRLHTNAAQIHWGETGVTLSTYRDLVGTSTSNYVHSIPPAGDEDYSTLNFSQTQTQISISAASFGTVTYNF